MKTYANRMREKLTESLAPTRLEIDDDSASHSGHAGAHPDGGGSDWLASRVNQARDVLLAGKR